MTSCISRALKGKPEKYGSFQCDQFNIGISLITVVDRDQELMVDYGNRIFILGFMSQYEIDLYLITGVHFLIGIPLIISIMRARSMAKQGIAPPPSGLKSC